MDFSEILKEGLELFDGSLSQKKSAKNEGIYVDVIGSRCEDLSNSGSDSGDEDNETEESGQELVNLAVNNSTTKDVGRSVLIDCENIDEDDVYVDMDARKSSKDLRSKFVCVDDILKRSVVQPGFEKLHSVPCETNEKKLKLIRKKLREKTKGVKWFNMPATEVTDEVKNDLTVLQMRSVLDPKHFYKKNDLKVLPKYFQVGKVLDAAADFYSSRIPKRERKKTIVEELLADSQFKKYNKSRYLEIVEQKARNRAHRHAKRLKRKGKSKK